MERFVSFEISFGTNRIKLFVKSKTRRCREKVNKTRGITLTRYEFRDIEEEVLLRFISRIIFFSIK